MKIIKLTILTTLAAATLPAIAAEYVLGVDYQPCEEKLSEIVFPPIKYRNCTIPGTKFSYSEVYTAQNGSQMVREVEGKFLVECSASPVCSSIGSPTYQRGLFAGDGDGDGDGDKGK